jgi:hypothetical protein
MSHIASTSASTSAESVKPIKRPHRSRAQIMKMEKFGGKNPFSKRGIAKPDSLASQVKDIYAMKDEEEQHRRLIQICDTIRTNSGDDLFLAGNRLQYLRLIMKNAGFSESMIRQFRDEDITIARNSISQERFIEKAENVIIVPPFGYSRTNVIDRLLELASCEDPDGTYKSGKLRQRFIRFVTLAGSMRRKEFAQLNVFMRDGTYVCDHIAKCAPGEIRKFISLINPAAFIKCLTICRRWIAEQGTRNCPDNYLVLDPSDVREATRIADELSTPDQRYTYKVLRSLGANYIAYQRSRKGGYAAQTSFMKKALRHGESHIAAENYGLVSTDAIREDDLVGKGKKKSDN